MTASDSTIAAALEAGRCPDCGATDFRPGPVGMQAQNIECRSCLNRFMVARVGTVVIFAQRIQSQAEGGGAWPPINYRPTDRVRVGYQGRTYRGHIRLAADNGFSLVVELNRGATLPLVWGGDGYFALTTGDAAQLEPDWGIQ